MVIEIIVAIFLFTFLLMTFIPTLPGLPLMFLLTVVYAFIDRFETLEPWHLILFGAIMVTSMLVDFFSGLIGTKLGGGTRKTVMAGLLGLVVGLIFFPPFGAFVGLFSGVFIAEIVQFRDSMKALKTASYSLATAVLGTVANIMLASVYFILFLVFIF